MSSAPAPWICCLCHQPSTGYGCNPEPLDTSDKNCCRKCDDEKVTPARIAMARMKTCCLCGQRMAEYGNNPEPLMTKGDCCNACNEHRVIPARLAQMEAARAKKKHNADTDVD